MKYKTDGNHLVYFHVLDFLYQETKQKTLEVNSRQSDQISLSYRGCMAVLFNLEHPAY
jgi:hypothetical protein